MGGETQAPKETGSWVAKARAVMKTGTAAEAQRGLETVKYWGMGAQAGV